MRNLKDYICENLGGYNIHSRHFASKYYNDVNTFFCGNIPKSIITRIKNGEIVDYINENLKTHDYKSLQQKLLEMFPNQIHSFKDYTGEEIKSFHIILKDGVNARKFKKKKKFRNLLLFYNYFYSHKEEDGLFIEPLYPELKNDYIYQECKGICYHFTDHMAATNILRTGLRCKGGGSYRNFSPRIFLYATDTIDLLKVDKARLHHFVIEVSEENREHLAILKIDLNKLRHKNLDFYKDACMIEPNALFTLNNIPSSCISEITDDKLLDFIYG